jgi:hypothetical protein
MEGPTSQILTKKEAHQLLVLPSGRFCIRHTYNHPLGMNPIVMVCSSKFNEMKK